MKVGVGESGAIARYSSRSVDLRDENLAISYFLNKEQRSRPMFFHSMKRSIRLVNEQYL